MQQHNSIINLGGGFLNCISGFLAALAISLLVSLCLTTNIHAAGTANVKEDFGAVGDGITDDTAAIQAAFDSDFSEIVFPEGEYKFTDQLTLAKKGNKTITGGKATLFMDNDFVYAGPADRGGFLVRIEGVEEVVFKGLAFEARYTEPTTYRGAFIGVMPSRGIHFDNCKLLTVPNLAGNVDADSTTVGIGAFDFFSGWHDVSVTNSIIDFQHDIPNEPHGTVYFRDIWGRGASDAVFKNNTIYRRSGAEIFWIAAWVFENRPDVDIKNIEVTGNRFFIDDSSVSQNIYTFSTQVTSKRLNAENQTIGVGERIRNTRIYNNEIIGRGTGPAVAVEGVENFDFYDNDLYNNVSSLWPSSDPANQTYNGSLLSSRDVDLDSRINTDTVRIHDNRTMALDSPFQVAGVASVLGGPQRYHVYDNAHITLNAPLVAEVVSSPGSFIDNNVTINGNVRYSVTGPRAKDFRNNKVAVSGYIRQFIQNFNSDLTAPAIYSGNTITATQKMPPTETTQGYSSLASMHQFAMNGHAITISNNTFINGSEVENDESLAVFTVPNTGSNTVTDRSTTEPYHALWSVRQIEDATPLEQNVYICNNIIKGFRASGLAIGAMPKVNLTCP
jgi:hypothetical protein